jgi:hypothetical protein
VDPFDSPFAECDERNSVTRASLPSARTTTLDKETLPIPRCAFFAECYGHYTRQSHSLSSVTFKKVIRNPLFYLFLLFHPNKQNIYYIYITKFTESSRT